jgi:hypothetical protein
MLLMLVPESHEVIMSERTCGMSATSWATASSTASGSGLMRGFWWRRTRRFLKSVCLVPDSWMIVSDTLPLIIEWVGYEAISAE